MVDRLSVDLREAFPDMKGLSPRNLKYMRKFAEDWPEKEFVQRTVAQIPWRSNIALLDKLDDSETCLWYARKTIENGWSRNILALQIEGRLHERQGKAVNNFQEVLPPSGFGYGRLGFQGPLSVRFSRHRRSLQGAGGGTGFDGSDHIRKVPAGNGRGLCLCGPPGFIGSR